MAYEPPPPNFHRRHPPRPPPHLPPEPSAAPPPLPQVKAARERATRIAGYRERGARNRRNAAFATVATIVLVFLTYIVRIWNFERRERAAEEAQSSESGPYELFRRATSHLDPPEDGSGPIMRLKPAPDDPTVLVANVVGVTDDFLIASATSEEDVKALGKVAAAAFPSDPVSRWLIFFDPSVPMERQTRLAWSIRFAIRTALEAPR